MDLLGAVLDSSKSDSIKQGQQDTILQWTPGVVHVFVELPQADLSIAQQLTFRNSPPPGVTITIRGTSGVTDEMGTDTDMY